MGTASLRNKFVLAAIAAMAAAVMAIGLSALPAQAYADYAAGTPATQVKAKFKTSKCKIKGTWRLVNSSDSYEKSVIKQHKSYGIKDKFTFKKNGKAYEKNYGKSKVKYKWKALSKKKGVLIYGGKVIANIKVKGKKLTIKVSGLTRTYKKM